MGDGVGGRRDREMEGREGKGGRRRGGKGRWKEGRERETDRRWKEGKERKLAEGEGKRDREMGEIKCAREIDCL